MRGAILPPPPVILVEASGRAGGLFPLLPLTDRSGELPDRLAFAARIVKWLPAIPSPSSCYSSSETPYILRKVVFGQQWSRASRACSAIVYRPGVGRMIAAYTTKVATVYVLIGLPEKSERSPSTSDLDIANRSHARDSDVPGFLQASTYRPDQPRGRRRPEQGQQRLTPTPGLRQFPRSPGRDDRGLAGSPRRVGLPTRLSRRSHHRFGRTRRSWGW